MSLGDYGAGYSQASATRAAANTAADAAREAALWQLKMWETTNAQQQPWIQAGGQAVNALWDKVRQGPGEYQQSPYYNFLLGEGTKGLERGAAARGKLLSGGEQKALTGYGQNLASTDYQTWLNNWYQSLQPYQSLAGLGMTAGQGVGNLGANAMANAGNFWNQAGQANAAGIYGVGTTRSNSISSTGNALQQYLMPKSMGGYGGVNQIASLFGGGGSPEVSYDWGGGDLSGFGGEYYGDLGSWGW